MILARRPEIERYLKAPDPDVRCAVIWGRDRGVVRERAKALALQITPDPTDPFNVALLTDTDIEADASRLDEELSAISMLGGRRLVHVKLGSEKAGPDRACAEALKSHAAGAFNADAFLLIEAGALARDSALRSAAEKAKAGAVSIPCYEDETGDVARMTRETLARDKVSLTNEALELFVSRLPAERGVARAEIERLILFLGPGSGATAGPVDLESYLGVEPEASLSDAAQDAFGARLAAAQSALRRAAAEGEGGVPAIRAVGLYLSKLRKTLTLSQAGSGLSEAAKASGVFWKQEREFLRQARAWSLPALSDLQADVLAADKACKQAGSPDHLIAERLVLQVAGRARRLGL